MADRDRSTAASLGCGTLIIIALIVLFLGRVDLAPVTDEIAALRAEVGALRTEVGALRSESAATRATVDRIAARVIEPAD